MRVEAQGELGREGGGISEQEDESGRHAQELESLNTLISKGSLPDTTEDSLLLVKNVERLDRAHDEV